MPMHDMSFHQGSLDPEIGKEQRKIQGDTLEDRRVFATKYYQEHGYDFRMKVYGNVTHGYKRGDPYKGLDSVRRLRRRLCKILP